MEIKVRLITVLFILCSVASATFALRLKQFTTSADRIESHGYPAETHTVETNDGYVLNLFRIPYSPKLNNANKYRPAILLQHGLLSNSDCYLSNGPDHSLAYNLADAGYDVWLGNARGNIYSRENTKISTHSPNFWRFSWHEIGVVDIAAMIDYIIDTTRQSSIHYVGHSQGTTVFLVLMSERPEYNDKIKSSHLLAPCAFFGAGTSPVFKLLSPVVGTPGGVGYVLLENMELFPQNQLINRAVDTSCGRDSSFPYCNNLYYAFIGDGYQNMNVSSLQVLLETHPGGGSTNQGFHFIQLYVSGEFRQYDFGKKNQQVYGQATPPNYDLNRITAPSYIYSSFNDALCGPADVNKLVANMPQIVEDYRIPNPTWNHLDFITANELKEVVNDRVIENCNIFENFD